MKNFLTVCSLMVAFSILTGTYSPSFAVDYTNGQMTAVPVKNGLAPQIDGDLSDWDLSAAEPAYISPQTARSLNSDWALMYDADALYVGIKTALPNRPLDNPNNPQDAFWSGDILQLRLAADPNLPYPLDRARDRPGEAVNHISFWKNSALGRDFIHINRGTFFDKGQEVNPPGAQLVITQQGTSGYVTEARLPWAVLKAPGGKFPFKPGQKMTFVAESLWVGGDQARVALNYNRNPGAFAFNSPGTWGQIEFAPKTLGARRRPELATIIAQFEKATGAVAVGVPLTVQVPADGLKVSVNIFGSKGEVLRELMGGEAHPKGALTVRWDGKDQWGHALQPGSYRWGAYFHKGLKAGFVGSVGASGDFPYQTLDGKGGWGGDHSNPIDVASDASGVYLLWPVAEAGRPIVKLDYQGNILWRKKPFVGGGFGPHFSLASDGKYLFLTLGDENVRLVRMDAQTGELLTWGEGGPTELPLYQTKLAGVPQSATPVEGKSLPRYGDSGLAPKDNSDKGAELVGQPDPMGLAARGGQVFLSSFAGNRILVINGQSGKIERELACAGPRGLAFDNAGNLFAVSYVVGKGGQVVRFARGGGRSTPVVTSGLEAPYDVALDAANLLYVSDLGHSQQVKVFNAQGGYVRAFGKAGGRPWQGKYNAQAFLNPSGLTVDARGGLLVVESSPPKVISRLRTSDGKIENRWFGPGIYWNATWPMPDDPRNVFYSLTHAWGRARIAPLGKTGVPEAYWQMEKAGYDFVGDAEDGIPQPEVVPATNGELYFAMDGGEHPVFLLRNDVMRPVASWSRVGADKKRYPENTTGQPYINVWIDANSDGQPQESEYSRLSEVGGKPIPEIAATVASMHMEPNGDLYFMTQGNSILKVPAAGFSKDGSLRWNLAAASYAVPEVLPGQTRLSTTHRQGVLGARLDSSRNIYAAVSARLESSGQPFDFPTKELAATLQEGMGHTSRVNVVKIAKYDPQGKLLWMAGRKATAGAKPGEIYHTWNLAGLVNDRYIAAASEWGTIAIYTHDGFFVDSLMNNPGEAPPPGPYTNGGETAGGRVQYFAKSGEMWAYSIGKAFQVKGFKKGQVEGESRASGTVLLDKVYESETIAPVVKAPLQIVALSGNPLQNAAAWANVPTSTLTANGASLATAQLGYDALNLYVRMHVTDATPLQNEAEQLQLAFKGGDTTGIVLGPIGERIQPGAGDVRFMAARINGQPKLIAMKAVTAGVKAPFEYFTPAAGTRSFEFVGEVPGAQLQLAPEGDGYTATFAVPRSFLEFELKPGANLRGDVEVRLSGAGARGLQAVSRNYLFTPSLSETTMTDDVPTEARLYPQHWGEVTIR
jgi:hypothetical protein